MRASIIAGLTSIVVAAGCGTATSPAPGPATPPTQAAMTAEADAAITTTDGDAPAGLTAMDSTNDFSTTVAKVHAAIEAKGLKIMAQIDHAANAEGVGMELGPTTVVLFGNPKAGTQLMAVEQTAGIDLPMKLIVWEDAEAKVHIGYNDPAWIAQRHGVTGKDELVARMQRALGGIAAEAAQ